MKNEHKQAAKKYDLAVIGAGPAGSLSAALAAEAGFSTVILEKNSFPRFKPCGGFISSRALSLLPHDLDLGSALTEPVNRINVISKNRCFSYHSKRPLGLLIKRDQFDHLLVRYACQKGAVFLEKHTLIHLQEIISKGRDAPYYWIKAAEAGTFPVTARYVIGADGAMSSCGLLSGLRTNKLSPAGWGLSKFAEAGDEEINPGTLTFYPLPLLGGAGWSFHGSCWINRGVGGLVNREQLKKAYNHLFQENKKKLRPVSWPLPFLGPLKVAGRGNLILAGDAAGLIEPFSGEGLYNTFKSAILALSALTRAEMDNKKAGDVYNNLYREHFRKAFIAVLTGAVLLHGRSVINPASLPGQIVSLMENRLWFNRPFP